jgi:hypothetical protein
VHGGGGPDGEVSTLLHFALRHQILGDITALPGASVYAWYEQGADSQLPLTGVFPRRDGHIAGEPAR